MSFPIQDSRYNAPERKPRPVSVQDKSMQSKRSVKDREIPPEKRLRHRSAPLSIRMLIILSSGIRTMVVLWLPQAFPHVRSARQFLLPAILGWVSLELVTSGSIHWIPTLTP